MSLLSGILSKKGPDSKVVPAWDMGIHLDALVHYGNVPRTIELNSLWEPGGLQTWGIPAVWRDVRLSSLTEIRPEFSGLMTDLLTRKGKRSLIGRQYSFMPFLTQTFLSSFDFPSQLSLVPNRRFTSGPKFDVNGVEMTKDQVLSIDPTQRTVAHWMVLVDWDLQRLRPYVLIDPYDPSGLLYLNSAEYLVQARTLASSNVPFIVICRPGTKRPVPTKTPPLSEERIGCVDGVFVGPEWKGKRPTRRFGRFHRYVPIPLGTEGPVSNDYCPTTWREFTELRKWISKNAPWGEGETVKVNDGNIMGLLMMWHRELLHYLDVKSPGRRDEQLLPFIRHLQTLLRHNGPAFTIARLKISLFCLYSYIGGSPVTSSQMTELGHRIRLRGGLPFFLAKGVRDSIRRGSLSTIRTYASLFNIYKVLWGPHGESPLTTIQAPPYTGGVGDFSSFIMAHQNSFYDRWENHISAGGYDWIKDKTLPGWTYRTGYGYLIASAGANASNAMQSIYRDAVAWDSANANLPLQWFNLWDDQKMDTLMCRMIKEGGDWLAQIEKKPNSLLDLSPLDQAKLVSLVLKYERELVYSRPNNEILLKIAQEAGLTPTKVGGPYRTAEGVFSDAFYESWHKALNHFVLVGLWPQRASYHELLTGRLHSIPEPAGKVRVVAICDYFTQVGLKPLHEYIFSLLKCNPNDATFGQQEAVDRFAAQGHKEIFSYDLKAATDLIPVQLYREVLIPLIGRKGADLWVQLLSERDFLPPKDLREVKRRVRYTRGQPMGALSSWAGLALCHHALVQYAAMRAGLDGWFTAYLVLGDDIVIAHPGVAEAYLSICEEFGIIVGLAKSLVSKKGLMNFASQTLLGSDNISPISLGEELVAQNWARRIELANRINHRYGSGDGEKSEMLTLRRVLTCNQWASLQGELTGATRSLKERYVRFLLQNPFTQLSEENRLHIERLLDWLRLLCPDLPRSNTDRLSRTQFDSLHEEIKRALWDDLKSAIAKKAAGYKLALEACAVISYDPRYGWLRSGELVWGYLGEALESHFTAMQREKLWPVEYATKVHSTPPDLSVIGDLWFAFFKVPSVPDVFIDHPREFAFDIVKAQALSKDRAEGSPVRVGKLGAVQGRFPAPKAPEESLRAPLQPLLEAVARVLGVALPAFRLIGKPLNRRFRQTLEGAFSEFIDSRVSRDASLAFSEQSVALVSLPVPMATSSALVPYMGG